MKLLFSKTLRMYELLRVYTHVKMNLYNFYSCQDEIVRKV